MTEEKKLGVKVYDLVLAKRAQPKELKETIRSLLENSDNELLEEAKEHKQSIEQQLHILEQKYGLDMNKPSSAKEYFAKARKLNDLIPAPHVQEDSVTNKDFTVHEARRKAHEYAKVLDKFINMCYEHKDVSKK